MKKDETWILAACGIDSVTGIHACLGTARSIVPDGGCNCTDASGLEVDTLQQLARCETLVAVNNARVVPCTVEPLIIIIIGQFGGQGS